MPSVDELDWLAGYAERLSWYRLADYDPYPKQRTFHAASATFRERLFMAGNQTGKTFSGGMEMAYHLTGLYPSWWEGRRFLSPVVAWAGSVTSEMTRDGCQRVLLGRPGQEGSGTIPRDSILSLTAARGVADLKDTVRVEHDSGGVSQLTFKTYERGREKWQAESAHVVWFDEEPPYDVYIEGLTRTNATRGFVFVTFTPLMGMSEVVSRFLMEESPDRNVTRMDITDARHIDAEQREKVVAAYLPHEREARAHGTPVLGSGRVFPIEETRIRVEPFAIPKHWAQIVGIDFGIDHPFAAVRLAHDRDDDIVYLTSCYRERNATPLTHCERIKPWGTWLPVAWPHDGLIRDKGSGTELRKLYADHGLNMLPERAQFDDKSYGLEAGLQLMLDRMLTGRLKVFSHLEPWWEEFRMMHRKDGAVVKERDDAISATRYAIMMLRFARVHQPPQRRDRGTGSVWAA